MASMEARRIAHKHTKSQVENIFNPVLGIRDEMKRKGIQPKDHQKENVLKMREQQRTNRVKKQEESLGDAEPWKMKRFQNVESVLFSGQPSSNDQAPKKPFLKAGDRSKAPPTRSPSSTSEEERKPTPRLIKPAVPKATDLAQLAPRQDRNYISNNAVEVIHQAPSTASETPRTATVADNPNFGKVPAYIQERKKAKEEALSRQRSIDPDCPAGMRLMPEEERQETLQVLEDTREQVSKDLSRMPFVVETPSAVKRKAALETKLKEIEDAIKLFSRKKVYVEL
eukprot:GILJ01003908.1.p1 GENE.GILJ01003908.1~~GILJ01003908.1.p1  ORF type:complete len:283 (+),score=55.78 GILJ01003908.1:47-895(+)